MRPHLKYLPLSIASLVLATGAVRLEAQSIYLGRDEPKFTLPRLQYIKTDVEYDRVTSSSKGGSSTQTQRIYVAPTAGIGWNYFLYHPDLLTFSLLAEPGYSWQQYQYAGSTSVADSLLLNGNLNAILLQQKPYATTFNFNRSHEQYNYDFFNSATVDATSYGATSGYREGLVPFTVSVQHATRDSSGLSLDSTSDQTTASVHASNSRRKGDYTDLSYQFSQYQSTSTFASQNFEDSSLTHYLALSDQENFTRSSLNSSLIYNHQENQDSTSDDINASLGYGYQHTPHLRSFYDYAFAYYASDASDSFNNRLRAGLQHQLYDSLGSSIDIHGSQVSSESTGSTLDQWAGGVGGSLDYSKRLGAWGHLSVSDSAGYDYTHQDTTGGVLFINDESHTVPLTGLFFLNQPRDLSVVRVRDATGTITLVQGVAGDYEVITSSDPWQIQIHSSGPNHIPAGASVRVDYTVQPNPSGDYSTFNDQFQIRLSYWQERASVYLRYSFTDNQADSAAFVLENLTELQAGADVSWKGFRADANFTDRHSSLYDYQSVTLSEGYALRTSARSSAGIDLRQQWSHYPGGAGAGSSRNLSYYSYTARYEWHPLLRLSWNTEAGLEQQRGVGSDQDLIVLRSYLNWFVGKLDFRIGYEFQDQQYTTETRERHFVFLHVRRNF